MCCTRYQPWWSALLLFSFYTVSLCKNKVLYTCTKFITCIGRFWGISTNSGHQRCSTQTVTILSFEVINSLSLPPLEGAVGQPTDGTKYTAGQHMITPLQRTDIYSLTRRFWIRRRVSLFIWNMTGFDNFSAATVSAIMVEVSEIGGDRGPTAQKPPHPHLSWWQASAWAVLTDVGDIIAHQSSFDKSPFDRAHTIVSL